MRKRSGKFKEYKKIKKEEKRYKESNAKKQLFVVLMLIGIFCTVLFLNSFFNYNSGTVFNEHGETLGERYFLSGPDPYLNMRTCEETLIQGRYPYVQPHEGDYDPLLNYPVGQRGSRPPLFNMIAVSSTLVLQNFMPQMDALGWAMLFLPAIYGALLVFPIYGIARILFNRKVGLISALLVALIPIHIGGSHGSTLSLFDHDSFLLLLFACIFYFVIKSLKEQNTFKAVLYSAFAGIFVGAVYLSWTASQFIFTLLVITLVVIVLFDILKANFNLKLPLCYGTMFAVSLLVALPWIVIHQDDLLGFPTMSLFVSLFILFLYVVLQRVKTPWIITLPTLGVVGGIGVTFLYLIHLGIVKAGGAIQQLSITIFGEGIYGSKVSLTVAEARNFGISQSIMSFGPALYWIGITGFILYFINTQKQKWQHMSIFFITIFLIDFWLTTTAGRFLNDLIPTIVIFSAFCIFLVLDKIDYKKMFMSMKNYSGFGKRKAIHLIHVFGIFFVIFLVVVPNSFLALDAAVPAETKEQIFGQGYQGAFGNSLSKTFYWVDALSWLNTQDTEIKEDKDKPAFISWWDYGFYEAAIAHHPTVADNYQVGLYAAGNFKLSASEEEAVSVLIVRCCEGNKVHNDGKLTDDVIKVIYNYLKSYKELYNKTLHQNIPSHQLQTINDTVYVKYYPAYLMMRYIEEPTTCPSYNTIIAREYGNTQLRKREDNAMYHDCWKLMQNLTDKEITNFYKDIQEATGYSIRYYGTEQYDTQIFGVFTFLTDRGTQGFVTQEDDYFFELFQDTNTGYKYERWQVENFTEQMHEGKNLVRISERKPAIYDTLWYKTYYGYGEFPDNRLPTYGLKHFKLVYYSPVVVISKYYEGAIINGTISLEGQPYPGTFVYVFDDYGVPHDSTFVDTNGTFSLIAPAGDLTFRAFVGQNVNDLNQVVTLTVTEEEGRQIIPCNKTVSFNISYANIKFNVLNNQTNLTLDMQSVTYQTFYSYPFNLSYAFNFIELVPDEYIFTIKNSTGSILYDETLYLNPGESTKNVTIQTG